MTKFKCDECGWEYDVEGGFNGVHADERTGSETELPKPCQSLAVEIQSEETANEPATNE